MLFIIKLQVRGIEMINWSPEGIAFRIDSENYCHIGADIARKIMPFISRESAVADCGCGLGHVSLELCRCGINATAIDVCAEPLEALKKLALNEGIENLTVINSDYSALPEDLSFDHMIFCLSGDIDTILDVAEKHCTGRVIIIRQRWKNHRFSLNESPIRESQNENIPQKLSELGIPYEILDFNQERGQPFRSPEDAVKFFRLYDTSGAEITSETVLSRLVENNDPEFPYFKPASNAMSMIVLNVSDIHEPDGEA